MIALAILLFAVLLIGGCKTCHCLSERVEVEKEVIITKHDSIITIETDSASALALLHCDSLNQVVMDELYTINGERISLSAKIKQLQGNMSALDIQCHEDSLQQRIEWLERQINEKSTETIVKNENKPPPFYVFCLWFFIVVCIGFVCTIAFKVVRAIYFRR